MTTPFPQKTITFHAGETWRIDFAAHDADGSVMPLPGGTTAHFRLADNSGASPVDIFTVSTSNDISITDGTHGLGTITIPPDLQIANNIVAGGSYLWEFRVETPSFSSIQGSGKFKVLTSLFSLSGP